MNSIIKMRVNNPVCSFLILIFLSLIASSGDVILNTIFAIISTKNSFSFLFRFGINLFQIVFSSSTIYYLINVLYIKINLIGIKSKVNFYDVIASRWPAVFIIIPIIMNNHFKLIESSFAYVVLFVICLMSYFYFQSKNYLNLIDIDEVTGMITRKKIVYLASLFVIDLLLIQVVRNMANFLNI